MEQTLPIAIPQAELAKFREEVLNLAVVQYVQN